MNFKGLDMFVTESMEYVLNELNAQGAEYSVDEERGIVTVKGQVVFENPVIEVDEVPLPNSLFEGLNDD